MSYSFLVFLAMVISSMGYRNGARNDSCTDQIVGHDAFPPIPIRDCTGRCLLNFILEGEVDPDNIIGPILRGATFDSITCGSMYRSKFNSTASVHSLADNFTYMHTWISWLRVGPLGRGCLCTYLFILSSPVVILTSFCYVIFSGSKRAVCTKWLNLSNLWTDSSIFGPSSRIPLVSATCRSGFVSRSRDSR